MLSVRQLAKQLGCSRAAVKRAIDKGMLPAKRVHSRLWMIEPNQRALSLLQARLDYLRSVRHQRRERMKTLWRTGKLRPKRRKRVEVVERWKRPTVIAVGQGVYTRTVGIVWRDDEGETHCPCCSAMLKVK